MPSAFIALTVGLITFSITLLKTKGLTIGAGEYAPIPPVFGPLSALSLALWSCEVAIGSILSPSTITIKLASSPFKNSSITTLDPASPNRFPSSISLIATIASFRVLAIITPFPAASPSAFITIGAPISLTYLIARLDSVKTL